MSAQREAALDQAVAAICRASIEDYRKGHIDRAELEKTLRRRQPDIARCVGELLGAAPAPSCACGAVATTVVAGTAYCDDHAAAAPRLEAPRF